MSSQDTLQTDIGNFPNSVSRPLKRIKNTNCPFMLSIKINKKNIKDAFNATVHLEWNHNHPIDSFHVLSFRDIPSDVTIQVREMFKSGMLPGAAHREFLKQLRCNCSSDLDYHMKLADRSIAPRRIDFNYIYGIFTKEVYGTKDVSIMISCLEQRIDDLINQDSEYTFSLQKHSDDKPFICVVLTPLMKRVHKLVKDSENLVFFDSSGNMEEFNLRVFLMVTHSPAGALPLGIIVTSNEQTETLVTALFMFKSSLPEFAFSGSGSNGSKNMMTDNCDELHEAVRRTWPNITIYLCSFHILQQLWRWLHDKKHGVPLARRPYLLSCFKAILYANSEEGMDTLYKNLLNDEVASDYPSFIRYLESVYADKEMWAHCYRQTSLIRGNNTNNFCESQFLVLKDEVLNRQKEPNINGLLDKITNELEAHYRDKLLSIASGKWDGIYRKRFMGSSKEKGIGYIVPTDEEMDQILSGLSKVSENTFIVKSTSLLEKTYLVDMDCGLCECPIGSDGSPCKHQYTLWVKKISTSSNFLPVFSLKNRQEFAEIAIGTSAPQSFYEGLHDRLLENNKPEITNAEQFYETQPRESSPVHFEQSREPHAEKITIDDCRDSLNSAFHLLSEKLSEGDPNLLKGVMKFSQRLKTLPATRLPSALHTFGTTVFSSKKNTSTSIVRKRRGEISVQPEAVKRRKVKNGSRTRVSKGQTKTNNPFGLTAGQPKRLHNFSKNVKNNEAVGKKACRTMASKVRYTESATIVKEESK